MIFVTRYAHYYLCLNVFRWFKCLVKLYRVIQINVIASSLNIDL